MSTYLSSELRAGLDAALRRDEARRSRLRIVAGDRIYPVLRAGRSGITVLAEDTPHLRGLVDLFDGTTHLAQCLIVASHDDGPERHFEFKRRSPAQASAPLDFARAPNAPVALLN